MTRTATGPSPADWLAALLRGAHPARWLLALAGLAATGLIAAAAQGYFEQAMPAWWDWWWRPGELADALWAVVAARSPGGAALRAGPLIAVTAALWCLVGGWIARHELLARRGAPGRPPEPGPTALVSARGKDLLLCCPLALMVALFVSLPVLVAGWVNAIGGGVGAVMVSLALPVVLVADLCLLVLVAAVSAWPLMPVTVAAECSDTFDALSRAHNYALMRPFRFVLLTALAVALAGLPLAAVLWLSGRELAGWAPEAERLVIWLAAALSASQFWSLEVLVYLHLRASVDAVSADELAGAGEPSLAPRGQPAAAGPPGEAKPRAAGWLVTNVLAVVLAVGAWWLTAWLIGHAGGDDAWLRWGMDGALVPQVSGLYRVASLIAGAWGALWALLALSVIVRGLRGQEPATSQPPASPNAPPR
jgi:hypothetical protein